MVLSVISVLLCEGDLLRARPLLSFSSCSRGATCISLKHTCSIRCSCLDCGAASPAQSIRLTYLACRRWLQPLWGSSCVGIDGGPDDVRSICGSFSCVGINCGPDSFS